MLHGKQIVKPGERIHYDRKQNYQALYNYQWSKTRARFLKEHPLCKACKDEGAITPATEVDHIIPHKGSQTLFWDADNWQALCISCHSRKTMREGGFGLDQSNGEANPIGAENLERVGGQSK